MTAEKDNDIFVQRDGTAESLYHGTATVQDVCVMANPLRVRFTTRHLIVLLTLVCAYFAAWEATQRYAAQKMKFPRRVEGLKPPFISDASSPFPLLVRQNEVESDPRRGGVHCYPRRYYAWLFGVLIKLPVESEWHAKEPSPYRSYRGISPPQRQPHRGRSRGPDRKSGR